MADGSYLGGPESGRLLVRTARNGLGSKAGHDLTIEVTRWRGNVVIDAVNPASSSVTVEVDVDSFEVRQGTGGIKPLTDADRADIKNTLRGKILNTWEVESSGVLASNEVHDLAIAIGITVVLRRGDRATPPLPAGQYLPGLRPGALAGAASRPSLP